MLPNQGRPKKPLCTSTVTVRPTTVWSNTLLTTLKFSTFLPGCHEEAVRLYRVDPFPLRMTAFRMTVVLTRFKGEPSMPPFRKSRSASSNRARLEQIYSNRHRPTCCLGRFRKKLNICSATGTRKRDNMRPIGTRASSG